ncbi:hypothetical protein [Chroococcus sp. FPU101]|uniref:hypothetical protein n=1 Tax=Chroococcus sp. FPU101 TaxID=1974212 RepID=UPI001A8C8E9E|nr:hypothetical protein [Chroococcus sp. FPU101]
MIFLFFFLFNFTLQFATWYETWISQLSNEGTCARTITIYTAAVSLGFAIGLALLSIISSTGLLPYLLGGGFALLALLAMAMHWVQTPVFERALSSISSCRTWGYPC